MKVVELEHAIYQHLKGKREAIQTFNPTLWTEWYLIGTNILKQEEAIILMDQALKDTTP